MHSEHQLLHILEPKNNEELLTTYKVSLIEHEKISVPSLKLQ